MKYLSQFGRYLLFLRTSIGKPEKFKLFWELFIRELYKMGNDSFGIVSIISVFIGAVAVIQIGYQLVGSLVPMYVLGRIVRDSNILEFSPTVTALVMAGKIGGNIASEIGTMKVSEQIDALEIMGVNAAKYVVMPKLMAALIAIPSLVVYSMFLSNVGGVLSVNFTGIVTVDGYLQGLRMDFDGFSVTYALTKAVTFAFVITTISASHGYNTEGGALEVGWASTRAVVQSCIAIIFFDFILTQIMLYK
ncbi:MAG: ABC transporter permease [Bacteroidetes bacterium]|nr:ABC transporter permease [Bacteroidota bacterium]MCK6611627.1 ABC transporter permease [Bacteroidia bacterium]